MFGKSGQMALVGKQVKTPSPKKTSFSYRTKARSSQVDETLFGAPNRFLQQVETKRQSHDADWDPPWSTGPNSKGTPLLWTPFDFKDVPEEKNVNTPKKSSPAPRPRSSSASRMKKIRQTNKTFSDTSTNQYRVGGHKYNSPNKKLMNGSGDASASSNVYNVDMQRLFKNDESPVAANTTQESISMAGDLRASKMRLDLDGVSKEATTSASRTTAAKEKAMPVIRSRAGSNLGTKASKVNRSENSPIYDNSELENETITRALRLANQSKQAYNTLQPSTTPLSTPRSNRTPRGAPASPRIVRIARLSDFTLPLSARKKGGDECDDVGDTADNLLLSATGRSVPLSARSNSSSRPSSARSARSSRRNSASGLRPSWKP